MKKSKCEKAAERYEKRLDSCGIKTSNTLRPSYDFIKGAEALLRYAKKIKVDHNCAGTCKYFSLDMVKFELLEQWVKGEK